MITQVEIKNFRNIKEAIYNFQTPTTIIAGQNGLGKSNTLNAINWLLTNTLLTDNYGKNENDIDSIVPIDHQKGQHTEVSIWLESGAKFTKIYKVLYKRNGKVTGHTTDFKINDVASKNASEFYSVLYGAMNYKPAFKSLKIAEDRLFTDPLYALQKLEAKELRNLLVALGCSVTNEELYKAGFEEMRKYESKYFGKWDVMRKDLKKQREVKLDQIAKLEAQLEEYASVEEFDESILENLLKRRDDLVIQKSNIKNGKYDSELAALRLELQKKEFEYKSSITNRENEIRSKINELRAAKQYKLEAIQKLKESATATLNAQINSLEDKITTTQIVLDSYQTTISNIDTDIVRTKNRAKSNQQRKTDLSVKLIAKNNERYDGYATCPDCGNTFPISQEAYDKFIADKIAFEESTRKEIDRLTIENDDLKAEYTSSLKKKEEALAEYEKLGAQLTGLKIELATLKKEVANAPGTVVDMTPIQSIDNDIDKLYQEVTKVPFEFDNLRNEITSIQEKIGTLTTLNEEGINQQIHCYDDTLFPIQAEIEESYVKKSRWATKQSKQNELDNVVSELNDVESLLASVNQFIQAMIAKINEKAKEKTGFDFVMLEENLSNENITEVCYATVDGVPFKDLNTSKKIEMGVKFIERCKYIAVQDFNVPHNELPILADRLEGVDSIHKIKNITNEQFICTRVSNEENITII